MTLDTRRILACGGRLLLQAGAIDRALSGGKTQSCPMTVVGANWQ